ncbi:MAG: hypothetical protein JXL80_07665 [Planctomycetes bacterium]|nr:hypothetical protein [Planctomycetota bacterium]
MSKYKKGRFRNATPKYAPEPKMRTCLGEGCTKQFMSLQGERFCPACRDVNRDIRIFRAPRGR